MKENVCIIAEAGVNHNGNLKMAKQLIDIGAAAGADYIKFQTWITEEIVDQNAPKANYQKENDGGGTQFEMLKKLELSFDDFIELKNYCDKKGISFLSTPDDEKSLDFLVDRLRMEIIKIGSGEVTNIPFLRKIGKKNKQVILSTGMSNLGEVEKAFNTLINAGATSVSLLHCTSNYPASFDSVNLKAMGTLKNAFKTNVGYSDHTEGIAISIAAVALGASIIEKHFTIDKNLPGPDHKASLNPEELRKLIQDIRAVEKSLLGNGRKEMQSSEVNVKSVVSRGVYLKCEVEKDTTLTEDMLTFKRPLNDIAASQVDIILGKKTKTKLYSGDSLNWKDISFE